jgi:23S rRNA pseudouridine955/2504/2580 synthase
MKKVHIVDNDYIGSRFDRWFKKKVFNIPQSYIEKNLRKGKIKVNNKKIKSSYKVKKDDSVTIFDLIFLPDKNKKKIKKYIPNKADLLNSSNIFIENNENFVVINKPAGISVQSGTKSLKNILDILKKTKEFENSIPFPVHRIDKETTGILIVAKNRKFAQLFTSLFRIRKIHKSYLGIVIGDFQNKTGMLIDDLIYHEGKKKITLKAITRYTVIDSNNSYSLLKLNPVTGRKHQLRKQLLSHGHPILGDSKYRFFDQKSNRKNHLMLHAYKINFTINQTKYSFLADPSEEFKKNLKEKHLRISQK